MPVLVLCLALLVAFALKTEVATHDDRFFLPRDLNYSTPTVWNVGVTKAKLFRLHHACIVVVFGLVVWLLRKQRLWAWFVLAPIRMNQEPHQDEHIRGNRQWHLFRNGWRCTHDSYLPIVWWIFSRTGFLCVMVHLCIFTQSPRKTGTNSEGQTVNIIVDTEAEEKFRIFLTAVMELLGGSGSLCLGFFAAMLGGLLDGILLLLGSLVLLIWVLMRTIDIHTWALQRFLVFLVCPLRAISSANGILIHALSNDELTFAFSEHPYISDLDYIFSYPFIPGGMPGMNPMAHGYDYDEDDSMHGLPDLPPSFLPTSSPSDAASSSVHLLLQIFYTVVVVPFAEEFVFRFMLKRLWSYFARLIPNRRWRGRLPFAVVTSFIFAACHLNNHIPNADVVSLLMPPASPVTLHLLQKNNKKALKLVSQAVTHFLVTFFLSLHVLTPLYNRWGLWASVAAHAYWNASCFAMQYQIVLRLLCMSGLLDRALRGFRPLSRIHQHGHGEDALQFDQEHVRQARLARFNAE